MDVSTASLAPSVCSNSTLVISQDHAFADQLRGALQQDHQCQVSLARSYADAEAQLAQGLPQAVFLDLRKSSIGEDPAPLLALLSQQARSRIPVIAIADSGYVCDWAAMADLIVNGHLQLPLDRSQLARLMEAELAQNMFDMPPGPVTPRVVRSRSVTIKTFTPEMCDLLDHLELMASHDVTVLLVGETGTGKTTIARLIHELSPRRDGKLLTVACGALPPELIESELFGHVKGSFTSADQTKLGKFEVVQGGSFLLDEIDVLRPAQQAKLLRVIETGEFEPVGSNETRRSRARLIVASNVDLKECMEQNLFRADLYYRLNMLELRIPPLRERPRDIVPLTLDFVEEFCNSHKVVVRRVHPDFLACLKNYRWPGNVRELKNHVRRAVLFCRGGQLTPHDLAPHFRHLFQRGSSEPARTALTVSTNREASLSQQVANSERHILEQALRDNNFKRIATAKALGISRVALYKKMKKYGLLELRD